MRKIIAPSVVFTLGLLSLPLAIVSNLYLGHTADVGAQGTIPEQFVIPTAALLPGSIFVLLVGAVWLAVTAPRHLRRATQAAQPVADEEAEQIEFKHAMNRAA